MKTVSGFSHLETWPRRRLKPARTPRVNKVCFDFEDVTPDERHALTALCTEYVWRIDNGYAAAAPALFTADSSMELPWGTPRGAAELKAAWEERAGRAIRTRHMISHLRFSRLGADEIAGEVSLTLYHADAEAPRRPRRPWWASMPMSIAAAATAAGGSIRAGSPPPSPATRRSRFQNTNRRAPQIDRKHHRKESERAALRHGGL
jgi:phytoene dehydrogenase-like protein